MTYGRTARRRPARHEHGLGEAGVLAEQAVAGVHRLRAGRDRGRASAGVDVQGRTRRPAPGRSGAPVGERGRAARRRRRRCSTATRAQAQLPARADDPHGDLAAVRDQHRPGLITPCPASAPSTSRRGSPQTAGRRSVPPVAALPRWTRCREPDATARHGRPARRPARGRPRAARWAARGAVARHRESGRLPVRERIALLLDAGSWFEIGALALPELRREKPVPGDARRHRLRPLDGRAVGVIGIDASVARRHHRADQHAQAGPADRARPAPRLPARPALRRRRRPHARRHGLAVLAACRWTSRTFLQPRRRAAARCRAPRPCSARAYGDSALHASTAHFVVMPRSASIALSGPSVVRARDRRAGHRRRARRARRAAHGGRATPTSSSSPRPTRWTRIAAFLSYLPANAALPAPPAPAARRPPATRRSSPTLVPLGARARLRHARRARRRSPTRPASLPWGDGWGASLICALARIEGTAGRASSPASRCVRAGALDPAALAKEATFVDLCDTFNLPLVFLHDVPGLMIGTAGRARRHPARPTSASSPRIAARDGAEGRRWCSARPTAAGTSRWADGPPSPTSCSPGRPPSWASWPRRPASAPSTGGGWRLLAERGRGGPRRAASPS